MLNQQQSLIVLTKQFVKKIMIKRKMIFLPQSFSPADDELLPTDYLSDIDNLKNVTELNLQDMQDNEDNIYVGKISQQKDLKTRIRTENILTT